MEQLCIKPDGDISHKENPFDKEFVFPDGCRMAIQVCSSHDTAKEPCWTQGVDFGRNSFRCEFFEDTIRKEIEKFEKESG